MYPMIFEIIIIKIIINWANNNKYLQLIKIIIRLINVNNSYIVSNEFIISNDNLSLNQSIFEDGFGLQKNRNFNVL